MSSGAPGRATLAVLVTYHDECELLTACLRSFLEAPEPPDRVLVFDDASVHPAAAFVPAGAGVEVVRSERNVGPAAGRNRLLAQVDTNYVHFHDADDLVLPDWARRVREAMRDGVEAVFTEVQSIEPDGAVLSDRVLGLSDHLTSRAMLLRRAVTGILLTPAGTYERGLLRRIGGFDEELWGREDWLLGVRVASLARTWRVLQEPLVRIRIHASGLTHRRALQLEHGLRAVGKAASSVPPSLRPDLADVAISLGRGAHAIGQGALAREAFLLARRLGPPRLSDLSPVRRVVTRSVGLELEADLAATYRRSVPSSVRRALRSLADRPTPRRLRWITPAPSPERLSVIVPTYNRHAALLDALASLSRCDPAPLEVIVVDQSDVPMTSVPTTGAGGCPVRLVRLQPANAQSARNLGARLSRGELLLFLDDDVLVDPGLVGAHAAAYQDPTVGAVAGHYTEPGERDVEVLPPDVTGTATGWLYFPHAFTGRCDTDSLPTCNGSIRRSLLFRAGGFDENFIRTHFDDADLSARIRALGARILHEPSARLIHLKVPSGGKRPSALDDTVLADRYAWQVWVYFFWLNFGLRGLPELALRLRGTVVRRPNVIRPWRLARGLAEVAAGVSLAARAILGGRKLPLRADELLPRPPEAPP